MSNNANPLMEAQTDVDKAADAVFGLLNPKEETGEKAETQKEEIKQNSPEPQNEESSNEEQPQEQEISEDAEVSEQEVSQDEQQTEIQEELEDSTYKVKVAGQELDVTLDELKNGYSRDSDYRLKTEKLSHERKNFQSESEKQRQDLSKKFDEVNQALSFAQQQLNQEISSADLTKLYEEDPTEAARIEHRLRKKQEVLNDSIQKTEAARKQEKQMQDQQRKLVSKMPEFSDPAKASSLKANMKSTLNNYGFNDQEVAQVYDHRIVMLVNDAMKYRSMQNSKPNLAKKISKPSKVFSSGVKQGKTELNQKARKEKFSRLRKSGSTKDATSIFLDMINNK